MGHITKLQPLRPEKLGNLKEPLQNGGYCEIRWPTYPKLGSHHPASNRHRPAVRNPIC
jgi:hypothetical protein